MTDWIDRALEDPEILESLENMFNVNVTLTMFENYIRGNGLDPTDPVKVYRRFLTILIREIDAQKIEDKLLDMRVRAKKMLDMDETT